MFWERYYDLGALRTRLLGTLTQSRLVDATLYMDRSYGHGIFPAAPLPLSHLRGAWHPFLARFGLRAIAQGAETVGRLIAVAPETAPQRMEARDASAMNKLACPEGIACLAFQKA